MKKILAILSFVLIYTPVHALEFDPLAQFVAGESKGVTLVPNGRTDAGVVILFFDDDRDGMSNEYETANGLDPNARRAYGARLSRGRMAYRCSLRN